VVIDPVNLCTVLVSPRQRAHRTFHLLFEHLSDFPRHIMTEEVREWDYGEYEGLLSSEIKQKNPNWSIWKDGYEATSCIGIQSSHIFTVAPGAKVQRI